MSPTPIDEAIAYRTPDGQDFMPIAIFERIKCERDEALDRLEGLLPDIRSALALIPFCDSIADNLENFLRRCGRLG